MSATPVWPLCSRSWLAARAIEKLARAETAFMDFVQEGEDDIAAGRYLTQEEMEEWVERRVRDRQAVRQAAE